MTHHIPHLSIVVPNLNDAESLVPFLQEIADVFINQKDYVYELIVVDDGSTDNSVEKILEYSKSSPNIKLIELSRNFGQQIALYVGLTQSKGQIMVTVDGDGQYPPECIIKLADAIRDGYEMASGNRKNRQDDIFGRITSKIGAYLIKRVLDQTITDFGSIKAFSRKLVERIVTGQVGDPDVYPAALYWMPKLKELDIEHRPRMKGQSKWSLISRLKLYFDLYLKYSRDKFGLIFRVGVTLILSSIILTILMIIYKTTLGHQESFLMIIALGAIFGTVGLQFILWSFLASALKQLMRKDIFNIENFIFKSHSNIESSRARSDVNEIG